MTDIISDTAACPMEDIDSFIQKDNFLKAHEILLDNGFEFKFRSEFEKENLQEAFLDGSTEYFMPMPDGGFFHLRIIFLKSVYILLSTRM